MRKSIAYNLRKLADLFDPRVRPSEDESKTSHVNIQVLDAASIEEFVRKNPGGFAAGIKQGLSGIPKQNPDYIG